MEGEDNNEYRIFFLSKIRFAYFTIPAFFFFFLRFTILAVDISGKTSVLRNDMSGLDILHVSWFIHLYDGFLDCVMCHDVASFDSCSSKQVSSTYR